MTEKIPSRRHTFITNYFIKPLESNNLCKNVETNTMVVWLVDLITSKKKCKKIDRKMNSIGGMQELDQINTSPE